MLTTQVDTRPMPKLAITASCQVADARWTTQSTASLPHSTCGRDQVWEYLNWRFLLCILYSKNQNSEPQGNRHPETQKPQNPKTLKIRINMLAPIHLVQHHGAEPQPV